MYKKVELINIVCDECGQEADDELAGMENKKDMDEVASANDFVKVGDIHYCSECAKEKFTECNHKETLPDGYIARQEEAERRIESGDIQFKCPVCNLYIFESDFVK